MLATVGLMVSVAALLIVIGIGVTQIIAAENHRNLNLLSNIWFDLGCLVAGVGMLWGAITIASIGSQAKALKEFPALKIQIIAGSAVALPAPPLAGIYPTHLPAGLTTPSPWYSQMIGVRITNCELTRSASLAVRLQCILTPGFGSETELSVPPTWQEDNAGGLGGNLVQLRGPIDLKPRTTVEGFMIFDFMNASPHLTDDRKLELVDHNCGRSALLGIELSSVHDLT